MCDEILFWKWLKTFSYYSFDAHNSFAKCDQFISFNSAITLRCSLRLAITEYTSIMTRIESALLDISDLCTCALLFIFNQIDSRGNFRTNQNSSSPSTPNPNVPFICKKGGRWKRERKEGKKAVWHFVWKMHMRETSNIALETSIIRRKERFSHCLRFRNEFHRYIRYILNILKW